MADDGQSTLAIGRESPPRRAVAVTPNDSADLSFETKALWVGGAGNVSVITAAGDTVTFSGAQAGSYIIGRFARVRSTGTTATNIVAQGDW
jgi:hypothetical protein